jgi:glycerophosphoryl diester phosphodiesterase
VLTDIQLIAHRGASAHAPENTFAAFEKAEAMGAQWIEFDVMLSADGEAFVFHDETLNRTTNGQGQLGFVSSEYLSSLDAGSWFSKRYQQEKIPTFRETLAWFAQRSVQANIEIKPFPGRMQETTLAVISHLHLYWPQSKALPLVSSFDVEALRLCHSMVPELPLGLLLSEWRDDVLDLLDELGCVSVNVSRRIVTRQRVQQMKEKGYFVCVFTVNRRREAERYLQWGADAVFSNYPLLFTMSKMANLFKKILDKRN